MTETPTRSTRQNAQGNGNGQAGRPSGQEGARRPYSSSTKFADKKLALDGNVEAALDEQLQDDRYAEMRSDLALSYLDNLPIPSFGDAAVPGYKLITKSLADELGLVGAGEEGDDFDFDDFPPDEPTPEDAAAIDGNLVHTFVDGIRGQHLFDCLNATLLAQLAANFKFDRNTEPVPWTKYYGNVLENVGWVVPQFDFRKLTSSGARFSLNGAVVKLLTSILSGDQIDLVKNAMASLEELHGDDRRLTIFRKNSTNGNNGNFQITGVGESARGILQLATSAFSFHSDESVTDVLWFRFNSGSTTVEAVRTTFVLNDQVYDRLRDAVIDKLGNRGLKFIARLPLADEE
jgi:hypothetical protein